MKWSISSTKSVLVWTFAVLVFSLVVGLSYMVATKKAPFTFQDGLNQFGGLQLWWVVGAFGIGALGSGAFLLVAGTGLIPYAQKASLDATIKDALLRNLYLFLGGIISAVFQLAQPQTFAPIQALIIGVTWPSVVNQYLGGKEPPSPADNLQKILKQAAPDDKSGSGQSVGGPSGTLLES